jgi:integrase
MASLSNDRNGTRRIQFIGPDGGRRAVRLGRVPTKTAEAVLRRVEEIIACRIAGTAESPDLAAWLASVPAPLYKRLVRVGLAAPRIEDGAAPETTETTLAELIDKFIARTIAKPATVKIYQQTAASLRAYFGGMAPLSAVTHERAEDWRKWLSKPHPIVVGRAQTKVVKSLAVATQAKRLEVARQIFAKAVAWELISRNPFSGVRGGSKVNTARMRYVSREETAAILAACQTAEWRVIVALCRYAGLRCPSELIGLRWADLDWNTNLLRVRSVKTEHHGRDHAWRDVPIGDDLRRVLADCYADAEAEEIVPGLTDGTVNLRTEFSRIVVRAGLAMWEKPFQNLRSSCETDWFRQFPGRINDVAKWMGHSPEIAMRHYLQAVPQGVDDATASETGEPVRRSTSRTGARPSGAVAQNQAQQRPATDRNDKQAPGVEPRVPREKRESPRAGRPEGSQRVGATGFEPATSTSRT